MQKGSFMKRIRLLVTVASAVALVPLSATAAFAAPPANDTPDGAIALNLGDTVKEDTTKATTDKQDQQDNRFCGAPYTNASVWYTYTPSQNGAFVLDMSKSSYTGGFMVFNGEPAARTMIGCGPTSVGIDGASGTTYYIMAFSDTRKNGGNLVVSLEEGPPAPTISVTVDPVGTALPNGDAQVSGTFTCTDSNFVEMDGTLTQIWKRVKINGFFYRGIHKKMCDGQAHDWSQVVRSDNGIFAKGPATLLITGGACGEIECTDLHVKKKVTLKESGRATLY